MNKPKPPCGKYCENRAVGCRKVCEAWKVYEVEQGVYRAIRSIEVQGEADYKEVVRHGVQRATHRRNPGGRYGRPSVGWEQTK